MSANLDLDVLRTLIAAQRLGSFSRAAEAVGRSQSAISQQIRRLEAQVGAPLFQKQGRGLVPTVAGETVLAYAQRLVALNDEAVTAARGTAVEGVLRFGLPGDLADSWLPDLLGRFRRAHPGVRIEVTVERNRRLFERLDHDEFDLVVALDGQGRGDAVPLAELEDVWLGPASGEPVWAAREAIPLAVLEAPCMFRQAAISALDRAGQAWRVAFTSPSLHGLWPALAAGLGVTLRTRLSLPPGVREFGVREFGVRELGADSGLPPLQSLRRLCLHDGGRVGSAAASRLKAIILDTLHERLGSGRRG